MNDRAVLGAVQGHGMARVQADSVIGIGINGTEWHREFQNPREDSLDPPAFTKRHGFDTTEMLYKVGQGRGCASVGFRAQGDINWSVITMEAG